MYVYGSNMDGFAHLLLSSTSPLIQEILSSNLNCSRSDSVLDRPLPLGLSN